MDTDFQRKLAYPMSMQQADPDARVICSSKNMLLIDPVPLAEEMTICACYPSPEAPCCHSVLTQPTLPLLIRGTKEKPSGSSMGS